MLCSRVALLCSLDQSPLPVLRGTPHGDQPMDPKAFAFRASVRVAGVRGDGRQRALRHLAQGSRTAALQSWGLVACFSLLALVCANSLEVCSCCLHALSSTGVAILRHRESTAPTSFRRRGRPGALALRFTPTLPLCHGRSRLRTVSYYLRGGWRFTSNEKWDGESSSRALRGGFSSGFVHSACKHRRIPYYNMRGWFPSLF